MSFKDAYKYWITNDYFGSDIHEELLNIKDQKEIEDRFYKQLEFGTGGLRGIISAGTNRMNIFTVRKASQGLADYVLKTAFKDGVEGIAIAYDTRRMSKQFAMEAACVFSANGIKAYLYREVMPTPTLSFAVRYLHCTCGIVITASHNPKEYNGYKVYGMDGGQITDALAHEIGKCISNVEPINNVKTMDFEEALDKGIIRFIGDDLIDSYVKNVLDLSVNISEESKKALSIVYTPLHGAGLKPVTRVLNEAGFTNLHVIEEQSIPDTEFSTVRSPNPEDHEALSMAVEEAKRINADIAIATDPDSDRLGIAVNNNGSFEYLNGNQLGCILLDTALKQKLDSGNLSADDYIIKTIVTTKMADALAEQYDVKVIDVLTGFKYIGEKIKENEGKKGNFIFGFEESYGYLAGTFVRDKDAIIAALLACSAAAISKQKGSSLVEGLKELYQRYGFYSESLKSYTYRGKDGNYKIKAFMESIRREMPKEICSRKVTAVSDYLASKHISTDSIKPIHLPKSDVIIFELEGGAWFAVRPSGTEPKLKIYIGVKAESQQESEAQLGALTTEADRLVGNL